MHVFLFAEESIFFGNSNNKCFICKGWCSTILYVYVSAWIALFTLPKAYEMNKAQVDGNLELARAKINEITAKYVLT